MKAIIGVVSAANFDESTYPEVLQGKFTEVTHNNATYYRIRTFEHYASYVFDNIFYTEAEYDAWLIEVPSEITKLQAVSLLITSGQYEALLAALDADETGASRILFDAAHQLYRDSNMVANMAAALDMTDDDINSFFVEASSILI